jgi:outer membrane lipoprotein-sorting protein
MLKFNLRFLLLSCLMVAATAAQAAEPAIIAKARAYLGGDAALNAITSLHYYGKLSLGADAPKTPITVEIIFEKPYRQRSIITSEKGTEVTVLDGYDGWQRVEAAHDKTRWTLVLLKADQIKNLRANVWENLAFFRGLAAEGGRVDDLGQATVDGVPCRKLAFVHSPEVVFYRYFDAATGRLVLTETKRGESIREQGTIDVAGVKFPKVLTTDTVKPDGGKQTITITFDRITVNEPVPAGSFSMPPLISQ